MVSSFRIGQIVDTSQQSSWRNKCRHERRAREKYRTDCVEYNDDSHSNQAYESSQVPLSKKLIANHNKKKIKDKINDKIGQINHIFLSFHNYSIYVIPWMASSILLFMLTISECVYLFSMIHIDLRKIQNSVCPQRPMP